MIYDQNTVPLDENDKKHLEGMSLADRGLREEAERLARRPLKAPSAKVKVEKPKVEKKKAGRPKKNPDATVVPAGELDPTTQGIRISLDFSFVREICRSYDQTFRLVEKLSTGNWKLSSPENGGIDLEYGYELQRRIREAGLI